jgi:hypothetical protein
MRDLAPYVKFHPLDKRRQSSDDKLLAINGVGEVKLDRHGATFVRAIASDDT